MDADLSRRRFFRQLAGDALTTAATVAGAAEALGRASAEAAGLVAPDRPDDDIPPPQDAAVAYREEPGRLVLSDPRPDADASGSRVCTTAADVARAMRDGLIRGAPVAAQVAAIALALTAEQVRDVRPWMRRSALRNAATTLAAGRVSSAELRATMARVIGAWEALGELHEDGTAVAAAVRAEASATIQASARDRAAMARVGAAVIGPPRDGPLRILLHGETGGRAAGHPGTALGVLAALQRNGTPLHVWVCSSSPWMRGPGSVEAELAALGIPRTLLEDTAAGHLVRGGAVDAVLVATECVAANGDMASDPGTYQLALLAAHQGRPFYACGTGATVDPALPDGTAIATGVPGATGAGASRAADRLLVDITDGDLVTAFITEAGVLKVPVAIT